MDPAHELVFTILSQHTSDINSARAFGYLMDSFGNLEAVAQGNVAEIEAAISPGGLAKVKAPRIKLVLSRILELNGSLDLSFLREMPLEEAKAWLRQLPGIGPKSAGIILNFSLGMPAMAIDTHIFRVCQRLRFIGPKVSLNKAHEIMEAKVPPEDVFQFHVAIINHGRKVCKAQRPLCGECIVSEEGPSRTKMVKATESKKSGETAPLKNLRRRQTGQFQERRRDVDRTDQSVAATAGVNTPRPVDDERRFDAAVVERCLITRERPAIVANEQHERVVDGVLFFEFGYHRANEAV